MSFIGKVEVVGDAHAELVDGGTTGRDVVHFADHHVARITTPALHVSTRSCRCWIVTNRCDALDELCADRPQGVLQTKRGNTGIGETRFHAEHGAQSRGDLVEIGAGDCDLTKPDPHTWHVRSCPLSARAAASGAIAQTDDATSERRKMAKSNGIVEVSIEPDDVGTS